MQRPLSVQTMAWTIRWLTIFYQQNRIHPAFADKSEGSAAHSDDEDGRDGRIIHDDDNETVNTRQAVITHYG